MLGVGGGGGILISKTYLMISNFKVSIQLQDMYILACLFLALLHAF